MFNEILSNNNWNNILDVNITHFKQSEHQNSYHASNFIILYFQAKVYN